MTNYKRNPFCFVSADTGSFVRMQLVLSTFDLMCFVLLYFVLMCFVRIHYVSINAFFSNALFLQIGIVLKYFILFNINEGSCLCSLLYSFVI
jgi:hypothetical protein